MQASSPTEVAITRGRGHPGWPKTQSLFVGAGFIPPAGVRAAADRADMESAPTRGVRCCAVCGFPGSCTPARFVGEGHGPPAEPCAAARFPGRCKHRPLQRLQQRGAAAVPVDRSFRKVCRGGFHIRPRVSAPPQGPRADMESAPTGVYNHTTRLRLPARPAFSPRRPACTGGALFVPGRPPFFRALFAKRRKSVYNRRNGGGRAAAIL